MGLWNKGLWCLQNPTVSQRWKERVGIRKGQHFMGANVLSKAEYLTAPGRDAEMLGLVRPWLLVGIIPTPSLLSTYWKYCRKAGEDFSALGGFKTAPGHRVAKLLSHAPFSRSASHPPPIPSLPLPSDEAGILLPATLATNLVLFAHSLFVSTAHQHTGQ